MASLKEIKARIASVNSTLKITSAMKMVASAKFHRIQSIATSLAEYEQRLSQIAAALCSDSSIPVEIPVGTVHERLRHATVVAFSSDSSLCGGFNANAVRTLSRQVEALRKEGFEEIEVYPIGEKILQASRKAGYSRCEDYRHLVSKPAYEATAALADRLTELYLARKTDRVVLVYNRFYSMGKQTPLRETFLPIRLSDLSSDSQPVSVNYICEPKAPQLVEELLPTALRTKLYAVLISSVTAEHAARTVAMQTASDNATELLDELSVTYNKQRQQAITNELADIAKPD